MKSLLWIFLLLFSSLTYAQMVPSACKSCLDFLSTNSSPKVLATLNGCRNECSEKQISEYKKSAAAEYKKENCFDCISKCPHMSKDMQACDQGCPDSCTRQELVSAFMKANEKAQACGGAAKVAPPGAATR